MHCCPELPAKFLSGEEVNKGDMEVHILRITHSPYLHWIRDQIPTGPWVGYSESLGIDLSPTDHIFAPMLIIFKSE